MQNPAEQPHIPALPEYERQNGGHASLLAGATAEPQCTTCGLPESTHELFRCKSCVDFLECRQCVCTRHSQYPLHFLEVWRGDYFECTTLRELGLVYQLGHGGAPCPHADQTRRLMTVVHTTGIQTVCFRYCVCFRADEQFRLSKWQQAVRDGWYPATTTDPQTFATIEVLELHRLLNVCATVNVRDFVTSLEKLTNPCGTEWVPDRYKAFGLITRQWSLLGRARRAGLGHRKEGLATAPLGSAAVLCWACPREGVNLPDDWREAANEDKFLFMLYLALDANFRMRSRLRKKSANKAYTIVGDGLGYQVPTDSYMEHLKNYVKEDDISTCIAFAALMQKDTKLSTGLRATGVGGCVCSRHELVRPLGIGDLLKGERYANMDYIFWAAIMAVNLLMVLLSYDIGCQWKVHLLERKKQLPALLKGDESPTVRVGTPVWHAGVHEESCETANSLRFKEGAAMTDGEGVERVWGRLGPWATATREMHVDGRHENLEDVIDQHNFSKNLGLGKSYGLYFFRQESNSHQEDWPDSERTAENPYASKWKKGGYSVTEVINRELTHINRCVKGRRQNAEEIGPNGKKKKKKKARRSKKSGATFIRMGLQLEQTQRQIRWMISKRVDLTATKETKIQEQRTAFFKHLKPFRNLQLKFMPTVEELLEDEEDDRDPDADPVAAENVKLYLPSDVMNVEGASCPARMKTIETQLRKAQCSEALMTLRLRLHAKSHVIKFRNSFVTGQKRGSRARTVIDTISDRVDAIAAKYRQSRAALRALVGEAGCGSYFELKPEDVSMKFVIDANAKGARRLARIQGRQARQSLQAIDDAAMEAETTEAALLEGQENTGAEQRGSSRRKLSWIWTVAGGPDGDDEYLHESVRIEWCKSYARTRRWNEEVQLLLEEMRRVLRSLAWMADWWMARAEESSGGTLLDKGRRAYARRQAAWLGQIRTKFAGRWRKVVGTDLKESS
ncbi:hypothetical protein BDZ89DRAFT_1220444 [Hymenopellis radicata]|nr:hypothetical protein BDZ89DRAFT_1220444 [Hymenopellis radicata]